MTVAAGLMRGLLGGFDTGCAILVIPVVSRRTDIALSDIMTGEAIVIVVPGPVIVGERLVLVGNALVVASGSAAVFVSDIATKVAHARVDLLNDDGLCFDLTDLFCDDPLHHLL